MSWVLQAAGAGTPPVTLPQPILTSRAPLAAPVDVPVTITLTGSGFVPESQVWVDSTTDPGGGTQVPATVVSATEITVEVTPTVIAQFFIEVRNGALTSQGHAFTVTPAIPPVITLVDSPPAPAMPVTPDQLLYLEGTGLPIATIADALWDGGAVITRLIPQGYSTYSAVLPPPLPAGDHTLQIMKDGLLSNIVTVPYAAVAQPTVASIVPNTGSRTGPAVQFVVTGTGFWHQAHLQIGDWTLDWDNAIQLTDTTWEHSIFLSTPSLLDGANQVTIHNPGGLSSVEPVTFTVTP